MPDRRCRRLSAVRSAVSSARASPVTTATTSPRSQRAPSPQRTSNTAPGSHCRNASKATSRPATTSDALAWITPRARSAGGHHDVAGHVAPPDVLGQRPRHEVAIRLDRRRRQRHQAAPPAGVSNVTSVENAVAVSSTSSPTLPAAQTSRAHGLERGQPLGACRARRRGRSASSSRPSLRTWRAAARR